MAYVKQLLTPPPLEKAKGFKTAGGCSKWRVSTVEAENVKMIFFFASIL